MAKIVLPRPPETDEELWWCIKTLFGVELPRVAVCAGHVSPFHAVAHAFFGKDPKYAVWYAARGSGKSLALAVLGLAKAFIMDIEVTILGGSMTQSKNVAEHMAKLMSYRNAPTYAMEKRTATELRLHTQKTIRPLPASQTTVRGPHPGLSLLDEIDEMEIDIYDAAMGQAMPQKNHWGQKIGEYIVASSTWQNPSGVMTEVIDRARRNGMPIFSWCLEELVKTPQNPSGWMTREFIDNKRRTVSKQMYETEYLLGEPSGASRAFDLDRLEEIFVPYPRPIQVVHKGDEENIWIWELPDVTGIYAVGADWAKEIDKTIIVVVRLDVRPKRIVKLTRINKRPYPVMIAMMNRDVHAYHAHGCHDQTGLGNVIDDYIDFPSEVEGFTMVGRARTELLLEYIAAVEHSEYILPTQVVRGEVDEDGQPVVLEQLEWLKRSHRATTVADVYAPGKWDSHLPDDVAACALMHRVATRFPTPVTNEKTMGVAKSAEQDGRKADAQFQVKPYTETLTRTEGGVAVIEEELPDPQDLFALMSAGAHQLTSWSPPEY